MEKFLKRFLSFSIGPAIGAIISFISVPVITAFISPEEYGKASMFTLFHTLITTIAFFGMDQSYSRDYHTINNKKKLFQNALFIPLIFSFLIFILILINQGFFSLLIFESTEYKLITILLGILIIFTVLERFLLLNIRMEERAIEYSSFSIIVKLGVLVTSIVFIAAGDRSFLTVVYSTIIGQIFSDLILIYRYKSFFLFDIKSLDKVLIVNMLKFGLPFIIASSLIILLNSLDRLFIKMFSDFYQLGIYTATLKISNIISLLKISFTTFWIPTAYRWYSEKKQIKHFQIISDSMLFLLSILYYIILFLKEMIVSILSTDYMEAKYIIALVCLPQILYTLSETTTLGIVFTRKTYLNIFVSLLSIIPNIIINLLLTPILGNIGAAIASSVSYICFFVSRSLFSNNTGFEIVIHKHIYVIILMFIAALLNTFDNSYITSINLVIFILTLLIQTPTIKKLFEIKNNPSKWDFN